MVFLLKFCLRNISLSGEQIFKILKFSLGNLLSSGQYLLVGSKSNPWLLSWGGLQVPRATLKSPRRMVNMQDPPPLGTAERAFQQQQLHLQCWLLLFYQTKEGHLEISAAPGTWLLQSNSLSFLVWIYPAATQEEFSNRSVPSHLGCGRCSTWPVSFKLTNPAPSTASPSRPSKMVADLCFPFQRGMRQNAVCISNYLTFVKGWYFSKWNSLE